MSSNETRTAAVAAGHPATADAAIEILADGGNAFDAVLAAMCTACVAEPALASLGGGGFLLARTSGGETELHDFFVSTPGTPRAVEELDFRQVHADFGAATQEFWIGMGSIAVPGSIRGLFDVHRRLGTLPMTRIVEPAARWARAGVEVTALSAFITSVIGPIIKSSPAAMRLLGREDGELVAEGDRVHNPELADAFEALAREGDALFYEGEMGRALVDACRDHGGHLRTEDLRRYRSIPREPLSHAYRGVRVWTNPAPAAGGSLINLGLTRLDEVSFANTSWGSPEHTSRLADAMVRSNRAHAIDEGLLQTSRGTTHMSVVDADGNLAALTMSNGEGCGYVLPGTGIMLNNVLGEEDVNPRGFHRWPPHERVSSMMAPTLLAWPDGRVAALGSGGSKRIRTAILQAIVNLVDFELTPEEAVTVPRMHTDGDLLDVEPGYEPDAVAAAAHHCPDLREWPRRNMYFGGVHIVVRGAEGRVAGAGDPRRGGLLRTRG